MAEWKMAMGKKNEAEEEARGYFERSRDSSEAVANDEEVGDLDTLCEQRYNEAVWLHWVAAGLNRKQGMNTEEYYPTDGPCKGREDPYVLQVVAAVGSPPQAGARKATARAMKVLYDVALAAGEGRKEIELAIGVDKKHANAMKGITRATVEGKMGRINYDNPDLNVLIVGCGTTR
jgi:hypothetical protein